VLLEANVLHSCLNVCRGKLFCAAHELLSDRVLLEANVLLSDHVLREADVPHKSQIDPWHEYGV